jgi:hypothetical protein
MKPRPVLSIVDAVTRMLAELGPAALAKAVGKSESLVRAWSDPDRDEQPSLPQAILLDRLWLASGRVNPPLIAAYRAQLRLSAQLGAVLPPNAGELRSRALAVQVEVGELALDTLATTADGTISPAEAARLAKDANDIGKAAQQILDALALVTSVKGRK